MGDTVTVGCKVPNGLLLRVFKMVEGTEPVLGGGSRKTKVAAQAGETIRINGFSLPRGPDFDPDRAHAVVGGFGLTHGVDADFFHEWMSQNKDSDLVKNGLIFAHESAESARSEAAEKKSEVSGLEPLRQDRDPRAPRTIQAAPEQKAA
jgi:hypothetical protein